jgi:hypothetical protein
LEGNIRILWHRQVFSFFFPLNHADYFISPLIFWDPEWGTIDRHAFIEHVVPTLHAYMLSHPGLIFQQDNAGVH